MEHTVMNTTEKKNKGRKNQRDDKDEFYTVR